MQGASQIRQSFSKRKRGIAQKAYQLHKITDAKVSISHSVYAKEWECFLDAYCCFFLLDHCDAILGIEQSILLQVFLFLANEKGASWAYSTPGFGAPLAPAHLKMLRQMAMPELDEAAKVSLSPM